MPYQIVDVAGVPGGGVIDSNGNLYVTYSYNGQIYVRRSADGGVTWTDLGFPQTVGYTQGSPAIVIDSSNCLHVVWTGESSGVTGNQVKYSKHNGSSWSAWVNISATSGYAQSAPAIAIDSANNLHVVWSGADSSYPAWPRVWYGTYNGTSWSGKVAAYPYSSTYKQTMPDIAVDSVGKVHVVYRVQDQSYSDMDTIQYSGYDGGSWVMRTVVGGSGYSRQNCAIAVGPSDALYVVWREQFSTGEGFTVSNLACSESINGGSNWTAKVELTADQNYHQTVPAICVDDSSGVHVLWQGRSSGSYDRIRKITRKGSWGSIVDLTSNEVASSRYPELIRNAVAGSVKYVWQESGTVLYGEYLLNQAPNAPILGTRTNFDATAPVSLAWTFSDADPDDSQGAYQLQIREVGASVDAYDTGKVAGADASLILPANTLTNGKQYQWRVKTWDAADAEGVFSSYASFYTASMPVAAITYPASDGASHASPDMTVTWSYSDPADEAQSAYQVVLISDLGALLWDSGKVASSAARECLLDYALAQGSSYQVELTIWNAKDVASSAAVRTFAVAYTPPATPLLTVTIDHGFATLSINNPEATGDQPTVVSNDIYRRSAGQVLWTRIARDVAPGGSYDDYASASGVQHEYKARAIGDTGATAESLVATVTPAWQGVWLHDALDPYGTLRQFQWDAERASDWQPEAVLMQFAGRRLPVAEFGESEAESVTVALSLFRDDGDAAALDALVRRKGTLCYRDGRGRKLFGVIRSLALVDQRAWGSTVSVKLEGISYSEEV